MLNKIATKLALYILRNTEIKGEDKVKVLNALIENLRALPIYSIIKNDEQGKLLINNEPLDLEKVAQLKESAKSALHNQALNLIFQQVAFMAVNLAVHQALNNEQVVFAKSALWNQQEITKLLRTLAQEDENKN